MKVSAAIETLEQSVRDPSAGLPDEVFYYISKTTPLINVDLLITDGAGRVLLAWRDDEYSGTGWHVPGGIVRFKETLEQRIREVARTEIGAAVEFSRVPVAVTQFIRSDRDVRGHFISLLYVCRLAPDFEPENVPHPEGVPGFLKWHDRCPADLLEVQDPYREYIEAAVGQAAR